MPTAARQGMRVGNIGHKYHYEFMYIAHNVIDNDLYSQSYLDIPVCSRVRCLGVRD